MPDDKIEKEILVVIESINRACLNGTGFDEIAERFADDFTAYMPASSRCVRGKEANLQIYKDFCAKGKFHTLTHTDRHISIFGDIAVMNSHYESRWEFYTSGFEEDGSEMAVFQRSHNRWQLLWRAMIPLHRNATGSTGGGTVEASSAENIRTQCQNLMTNSPACELTTIDADGLPYTTAMNNLRDRNHYPDLAGLFGDPDNDFIIYMSTHNHSDKMARMLANPKVSVYFCDAPRYHGLMLGGQIEIITDRQLKNKIWQKGWTIYYPGGPEGPEYGVLRLTPTIAKGWSCTGKFELKPGKNKTGV